ncbi:hypothetical protein H072_633 [Dactylellina haptotyla CBS 200.50]|uniref:Uncharacterized protein n=1 Tax=Dactylellina haptotyla (strain CBS 200.50) TaxID=1284197 RepID=S8AR18_DACHA|nr:hypothetical protein H072_633 [Dactylellina haptotyla CBS 200.50]
MILFFNPFLNFSIFLTFLATLGHLSTSDARTLPQSRQQLKPQSPPSSTPLDSPSLVIRATHQFQISYPQYVSESPIYNLYDEASERHAGSKDEPRRCASEERSDKTKSRGAFTKRANEKRPGSHDGNDQRPSKQQKVDKYQASIDKALEQIEEEALYRGEEFLQYPQDRQIQVARIVEISPAGEIQYPDEALVSLKQLSLADKIIKNGDSYQFVGLVNKPQSDEGAPRNTLFVTWISIKDKHMLIQWSGDDETVTDILPLDEQNNVCDMVYRCWLGENDQANDLQYISITSINDPDTREVLQTVYQKVFPNTPQFNTPVSMYVDDSQRSEASREIWNALRGTRVIWTLCKMLYIYQGGLHDAELTAIHFILPAGGSVDQGGPGTSPYVVLEVRKFTENTGKEAEASGSSPNKRYIDTVYSTALQNGEQNWKDALEAEIQWGADDAELHDLPTADLPLGLLFDYAWTGGQTYPFDHFLQTLEAPGSVNTWVHDERRMTRAATWRKSNIVQVLPSNRMHTIFRASASAEDRHFAFWGTISDEYKGMLSTWAYMCWVFGSNQLENPGATPDSWSKLLTITKPAVPLEHITLWNVENKRTIIILHQLYTNRYGTQPGVLFSFSISRTVDPQDGDYPAHFEAWHTLLGTEEIAEINYMCYKNPIGMRKAKIETIRFLFHAPFESVKSISGVSIIIGLATSSDADLELYDSEGANKILSQQLLKFNINLDEPLPPIKLASEPVIPNPILSSLSGRTDYEPSVGPSYVEIDLVDSIAIQGDESGNTDDYTYHFAMSSEEQHLLFKSVTPPAGKRGPQPMKEDDVYPNLGKNMFTAWFSQEGLSQISEFSFQGISSTGLEVLKGILSADQGVALDKGEVITLPSANDDEDYWSNVLNAFYQDAPEGRALKYIQVQHRKALSSITVRKLQIGRHLDEDLGSYFLFILLFKFPQPWEKEIEEDEEIYESDSIAGYKAFLKGAENRIEFFKIALQARGWQPPASYSSGGYSHDSHYDDQLIAMFEFLDKGTIATPVDNNDSFLRAILAQEPNFIPKRTSPDLLISSNTRKLGNLDRHRYHIYTSVSARPSEVKADIYMIATRRSAGHICIMDVPSIPKSQDPAMSLADAMYATWTHLYSGNSYSATAIKGGDLGIYVVSVLSFAEQSNRILNLIYNENRDLIGASGVLILEASPEYVEYLPVPPEKDLFSNNERARKINSTDCDKMAWRDCFKFNVFANGSDDTLKTTWSPSNQSFSRYVFSDKYKLLVPG